MFALLDVLLHTLHIANVRGGLHGCPPTAINGHKRMPGHFGSALHTIRKGIGVGQSIDPKEPDNTPELRQSDGFSQRIISVHVTQKRGYAFGRIIHLVLVTARWNTYWKSPTCL